MNPLNKMNQLIIVKLIWRLIRPIVLDLAKKSTTDFDDKLVEAVDDFMKSM